MRLHLGREMRVDDYIRISESLFDIAHLLFSRSVNISNLRNVLGTTSAACCRGLIGGTWIYQRRIGLFRHIPVNNERELLVFHLHELCRVVRNLRTNRRDGSDRLAFVAHDWIL